MMTHGSLLRRHGRGSRFALAILLLAMGLPGDASADSSVEIRWTATSNPSALARRGLGTERIFAANDDEVTATLYLDSGGDGVCAYFVSLEFDSALDDELDLVSAEVFDPQGELIPIASVSTRESTPLKSGLVEDFNGIDWDGLPPFPTASNLPIGQVTFKVKSVASDGDDVVLFFDYVSDYMVIWDGIECNDVTPSFGSAGVGVLPAIDFALRRVVATGSGVPGSSGSVFTSFGISPGARQALRVLYGIGSGGERGIYAMQEGGLSAVVDTSTPHPNPLLDFTDFAEFAADAEREFSFRAFDDGGGEGIYETWLGGDPGAIAEVGVTALPGGGASGAFLALGGVGRDAGETAFWGSGSGNQGGIYQSQLGSLSVVAHAATVVPPGGLGLFDRTYSQGVSPCFDQGEVVFVGGNPLVEGIYRHDGASLSAVVDTGTALPGSASTFKRFEAISLAGGRVAFQAKGSNGEEGIYLSDPLAKVADTDTSIPEGTGKFTGFENVALRAGGRVAFVGLGSKGIYTTQTGSLEKVVAVGEPMDGRIVSDLELSADAFEGNRIVFWAAFEDGSEGIFEARAPISVPGLRGPALGLLLAALLTTASALTLRRRVSAG